MIVSYTFFKSSDETLLCSKTRVVDGSAVKAFDAFSCRPSVDARLEGNARTDGRHKIRGTSEKKSHGEDKIAFDENSRIIAFDRLFFLFMFLLVFFVFCNFSCDKKN